MPASSASPSPHAGAGGGAGAAAFGAAVAAIAGGAPDWDAAGFSVAGEQASKSPDIAASQQSVRGKAMGTETSRS
jgi:hypothetical protein